MGKTKRDGEIGAAVERLRERVEDDLVGIVEAWARCVGATNGLTIEEFLERHTMRTQIESTVHGGKLSITIWPERRTKPATPAEGSNDGG